MKASALRVPPERLVIEDVEIDAPSAGEVLVRTVAAGVCHSNLHVLDGQVNFYPTPLVN